MSTLRETLKGPWEQLDPKHRQWATLGGLGLGAFAILWLVLSLGASDPKPAATQSGTTAGGGTPTNIGVMTPGQQVNPVDTWVGMAGQKVTRLEADKVEQEKINKDRKAFEDAVMKRFADLEQRQLNAANTQSAAPPTPGNLPPAPARAGSPTNYPPADGLPPGGPRFGGPPGMPVGQPGVPPALGDPSGSTGLMRVTVAAGPKASQPGEPSSKEQSATLDTFLPVSFTRGVLLGGLDAPTGGQSQSNPHPVLVRLSDNSVLPNQFRAAYRECFVVAAGYGDISSERAYLRTENLSCVRADGSTLEVKIQGSVYGEDGKVGLRGRLVTKQGQMLANALRAGIVAGIGQGFATAGQTSTSALGSVTTQTGTESMRAGMGAGVGRALDRLAQYYIKLAEQTFPIVEIDAGREIDVVITKGVRIDAPVIARARSTSTDAKGGGSDSLTKVSNDDDN